VTKPVLSNCSYTNCNGKDLTFAGLAGIALARVLKFNLGTSDVGLTAHRQSHQRQTEQRHINVGSSRKTRGRPHHPALLHDFTGCIFIDNVQQAAEDCRVIPFCNDEAVHLTFAHSRQPVKVDFRRERRPIAIADPGSFWTNCGKADAPRGQCAGLLITSGFINSCERFGNISAFY
jgi:hypothetical protein